MEIKIGDRVKVIYAGSQSGYIGKTGIVISDRDRINWNDYDYEVRFDDDSPNLFFHKGELEKVNASNTNQN